LQSDPLRLLAIFHIFRPAEHTHDVFKIPWSELALLCSILGGLVMTGLMLMTCYSLIGRNFFDTALIGDFELTGVGAGAAIALFMPLCQFKRENIIVDFFTAKCSEFQPTSGSTAFGDLLHDSHLRLVVLALRRLAAINAKETMGASMLLGFPDWIVFTSMCIPFGISSGHCNRHANALVHGSTSRGGFTA
jgi:hypothetical protein